MNLFREREPRVGGVSPRWPFPRKESNKCKGGRTFLAETEKMVWCERWENDFVTCYMVKTRELFGFETNFWRDFNVWIYTCHLRICVRYLLCFCSWYILYNSHILYNKPIMLSLFVIVEMSPFLLLNNKVFFLLFQFCQWTFNYYFS